MKKALIIIFSAVFCLTLLSACTSREDFVPNKPDDYTPLPTEPYSGPAKALEKESNFTLWSWQVTSVALAEEYASEIKKYGFDGIELCVRWSDFEPQRGKYDWRYLDSVLDVFVRNGFNLSLSILFWSEDLNWKDQLEYQCTADGEVYRYDDIRGSFLCLNSRSNMEIVSETVKNFAIHCAENYPENLTRWHIRTNCFADTEYASLVDLDYSDTAINAFAEFLSEKYSLEQFNTLYKQKYTSWEGLKETKKSDLTALLPYEWKLFKQDTVIKFANMYDRILKIAAPDIPTVLQLGGFWDTSASYYRGTFDLYTISKECTVDIIQTSDAPSWPHDFSANLMVSMSDKLAAMEIDGAWRSESEFSGYIQQAKDCGATGISYLGTVNWNLDDLKTYGEKYVALFSPEYKSAAARPEGDETDVILVNTLDFLLRQPPQDLYDLYYYAYKNMTGKSGKKVRFITDTQLIDNPDLINGIRKVHLGQLDTVVYMRDELGQILANAKITLVDDKNLQPNFVNQYGEPLAESVQTKLRKMLKDS